MYVELKRRFIKYVLMLLSVIILTKYASPCIIGNEQIFIIAMINMIIFMILDIYLPAISINKI